MAEEQRNPPEKLKSLVHVKMNPQNYYWVDFVELQLAVLKISLKEL